MCINNTRTEQYYHFCNIPHNGKVRHIYCCQGFDEKCFNRPPKSLLFLSIIWFGKSCTDYPPNLPQFPIIQYISNYSYRNIHLNNNQKSFNTD